MVIRIILKALDEPDLKDSPSFQFTQLLEYPSLIEKLPPERIKELSLDEVQEPTPKK